MIKNTKHTPGPWTVKENTEDGNSAPFFIDADLCSVADVTGIGIEQAEANAILIASAPELLDALKALIWQHDNNNGILCGMALQDARAAIRNATEE